MRSVGLRAAMRSKAKTDDRRDDAPRDRRGKANGAGGHLGSGSI